MPLPRATRRPLRRFGALSVLAAGLAFATAAPAHAVVVLDQNQPLTDGSFTFAFFNFRTQSFVQNADNIAGAGVLVKGPNSTGAAVTISVWDGKPGDAASNVLASGSAVPNVPTLADTMWLDVFWTPVAVVPGQLYYLDFEALAPSMSYLLKGGDPYAAGNTFTDTFAALTNFDYAFRTYADVRRGGDVPEPASLSVLALSLIGLSAVRRRP